MSWGYYFVIAYIKKIAQEFFLEVKLTNLFLVLYFAFVLALKIAYIVHWISVLSKVGRFFSNVFDQNDVQEAHKILH